MQGMGWEDMTVQGAFVLIHDMYIIRAEISIDRVEKEREKGI